MRRRPSNDQRGAASVLVLAVLGLVLLVGAGLAVVGALWVDHRSAQAAADLAALAAARTDADGGDGCAAAATVAAANGAELVACRVVDGDAWVGVLVTGPRWLGQTGDLEARARAGPAG